MTDRHVITTENIADAETARRDILMVYTEMAESYSGFGHGVDRHVRFDPLEYVDAELTAYAGYAPLIDIQWLRTGAAMMILCSLYDDWCEEQRVGWSYGPAVEAGRLHMVPDVEEVAKEALRRPQMGIEDEWFDHAVAPLYHAHVVGYFARLSRFHRLRGGA